MQIERFGIQPLVPTQETAHALWWADKKRFTAKQVWSQLVLRCQDLSESSLRLALQVLSQYEYTAKCAPSRRSVLCTSSCWSEHRARASVAG